MCRSGVRSHEAAVQAAAAGYARVYNVMEGFEGDKDAHEHRGNAEWLEGPWFAVGARLNRPDLLGQGIDRLMFMTLHGKVLPQQMNRTMR
jgi:hypothetical protein